MWNLIVMACMWTGFGGMYCTPLPTRNVLYTISMECVAEAKNIKKSVESDSRRVQVEVVWVCSRVRGN